MDEEIHAVSGVAIAGDPVPAQCMDLVKCFVNMKARKHLWNVCDIKVAHHDGITFRVIC